MRGQVETRSTFVWMSYLDTFIIFVAYYFRRILSTTDSSNEISEMALIISV